MPTCLWRNAFQPIIFRHEEGLGCAGGLPIDEVGEGLVLGLLVTGAEKLVIDTEPVGVVLIFTLLYLSSRV